jgi:hypothetical protein
MHYQRPYFLKKKKWHTEHTCTIAPMFLNFYLNLYKSVSAITKLNEIKVKLN